MRHEMKLNCRQSNAGNEPLGCAVRDSREEAELRAHGATCPMPGCGALVVSYEMPTGANEVLRPVSSTWEFVCPQCGAEFTAPKGDLLFQSVPRQWLFSEVCHA
jgi:hypothetical protein